MRQRRSRGAVHRIPLDVAGGQHAEGPVER